MIAGLASKAHATIKQNLERLHLHFRTSFEKTSSYEWVRADLAL